MWRALTSFVAGLCILCVWQAYADWTQEEEYQMFGQDFPHYARGVSVGRGAVVADVNPSPEWPGKEVIVVRQFSNHKQAA